MCAPCRYLLNKGTLSAFFEVKPYSMNLRTIVCGVAVIVAPLISMGCNAQKPKLSEYAGAYKGRWELDIEARNLPAGMDAAKKTALDNGEWRKADVTFEVTNEGEKSLYVTFQGEKLKLDVKKIKSEKDDGVVEHEALLALDVASVKGKTFSYTSADGALDVTFTIVGGKTELESGVRVDSQFELPKKEFEGEYLVECKGTYQGEAVSFKAELEIEFPK